MSIRLRGARRSAGFSLLEVIVAIAILGIGLVALIQLYASSLRSVRRSEDYTMALAIARSTLDEVYAKPDRSNINYVFDYGNYHIERKIEFLYNEEDMTLYQITVSATWPPKGKVELTGVRGYYDGKEK